MKHLLYIVTALSVLFMACGNQKKANNAKTEKVSSIENKGITSDSEILTSSVFIQKIWDYTKSPNEWKYLGSKPAIIDFYADWCGPCKIASPILKEIGKEYSGRLLVYKINTDQEQQLAKVFGITGIPAFLYIPAVGKPVMTSGIGRSKEETKKMFVENIEKYLSIKK
ncbi:MAG TPA: thioredoxin domain-containing protein [Prolixibacteraceae bacterium]